MTKNGFKHFSIIFNPVEPACSPVREGESTTVSCNVFTAECYRGILLTWTVGSREVAQCRRSLGCFGLDSSIFVTLNSAGRSTLTISSVSRTDPFNMEVKWTCRSCFGDLRTVCNKLEVYGESKHCTHFCICLYLCGFFYLFIPTLQLKYFVLQ